MNELEERAEELEQRAGEDMNDQESMEKEPMEVAGQPPVEKRSLLRKLRKLKSKVLGCLLCTS